VVKHSIKAKVYKICHRWTGSRHTSSFSGCRSDNVGITYVSCEKHRRKTFMSHSGIQLCNYAKQWTEQYGVTIIYSGTSTQIRLTVCVTHRQYGGLPKYLQVSSHQTESLMTGDTDFDCRREPTFFSSPKSPGRPWGLWSSLYNRYNRVKLSIRPQLVLFKKHLIFTSTRSFILCCRKNSYYLPRQAVRKESDSFLFCEGPCSRCYGRTAALRLIVQHCDEDNFFCFSW
jgi:hypothetical protein